MGCGASVASKSASSPNKTNNSGSDGKKETTRSSNVKLDTNHQITSRNGNSSKITTEETKVKTDKAQAVKVNTSDSADQNNLDRSQIPAQPENVPASAPADQLKINNSHVTALSPTTVSHDAVEIKKANAKSIQGEAKTTLKANEDDGEEPKEQKAFDLVLKSACLMLKPDSVLKRVTKNVTKLQLTRALPHHFSLPDLLNRFENLKELDISNNNIGPQCFRAVCRAMCGNSTILSLNLAGNRSDTDSADSLGRMLEENKTLQYLDVSSNYLGKDYFSRRVGEALKTNKNLKTLRAESVGTTDARVFVDGLRSNTSLTELDFSSNDVSDKLAFGKGLADCLKNPDCSLESIALNQCRLNADGLREIEKGLSENRTITELNLVGSEFSSLGQLLGFTVTSARHSCLRNLSLDRCQVQSPDVQADVSPCETTSHLQVLSLASCGLTDTFFTKLVMSCKGRLLYLTELNLTSNRDLTAGCIDHVADLTSDDETPSCLRKLTYGLNNSDKLSDKLLGGRFPDLRYLNTRMCHMGIESVTLVGEKLADSALSSVILDGLKMSNTMAVKDLLVNSKSSKLSTLSFGGCSLDDNDLSPLFEQVRNGFQLHMLKLSANRITDVGVASLVEAVLKNKTHPLAVLDLSINRLGDAGAASISKLCTPKSRLHSLNVSQNNIGKDGLLSLVAAIGGKSSLRTLYVQNQSSGLDEAHMVEIYTKLAMSLGYKVQMDGERVKQGFADIPAGLPDGLMVNMKNLGGETGAIGQAIDSPCIQTDFTQDRLPSLSFEHVMDLCSFFKGLKSDQCVWSDEEWNVITGADRATTDTPSWLKISAERDKCVYLSNLPGNTTQQKVEAILEMEADCNLDEVCLMKDPVTRSINGVGWVVMADVDSIPRAVDYFNSGEAKIFGQPFMMSTVKVQVDNEANIEVQKKAAEDRDARMKQRQAEDAAHHSLILKTTEESWKRHAYRLAHPAYADGRIW